MLIGVFKRAKKSDQHVALPFMHMCEAVLISLVLYLIMLDASMGGGGVIIWPEDDDPDKTVPIAQITIIELCKYYAYIVIGRKVK